MSILHFNMYPLQTHVLYNNIPYFHTDMTQCQKCQKIMKSQLIHDFSEICNQITENVKWETPLIPTSKSTRYLKIHSIRMNHWKITEITTGRKNGHTRTILYKYPSDQTNKFSNYQRHAVRLSVQRIHALSALWWLRTHNDTYNNINIEETNLKWMNNQELKQSCNNTIMSKYQICVGAKVSVDTANFKPRWGLFNGVTGIICILLRDVLDPTVRPHDFCYFIHSCLVMILI